MKARRVPCGAKPGHPACEPGLARRLHSLHRASCNVASPTMRTTTSLASATSAHSIGLRRRAILAGHGPCADGTVAAAAAPAEAAKPAAVEAAQLGKSDSVSSKKSAKAAAEPEPEPKPKKKAEAVAVAEPPAASKVPRHRHYGSHTRAPSRKHSSRRKQSRTCARGSSAQQTSFWAQAAWPELGKVKCQKTLVSPRLQTRARLNARASTLARNCRLAIHGTGPAATAALLVGAQCSEEAIALVRS